MKKLKEMLLNMWWKRRAKKHATILSAYDIARYGRIITVVRFHDSLLVISENSMWQISEDYNMGRIETHLIGGGRI